MRHVALQDPNRNKIAQWLNVTGQKQGVFQGSLQLSDNPPLGDWKIDVDIGVSTVCKSKNLTLLDGN
ncbi:hypothetical protein DPMN_116569 [Dreissena polymorpha]|uniref:Uncharacterized protein n=1 Tax=Dreissena polymorpha TaxID=45954 RepID=A0A9D4QUE4_DREPO|nr:hypothetical protein DPMN_116569 [Dreissena polymorpha]